MIRSPSRIRPYMDMEGSEMIFDHTWNVHTISHHSRIHRHRARHHRRMSQLSSSLVISVSPRHLSTTPCLVEYDMWWTDRYISEVPARAIYKHFIMLVIKLQDFQLIVWYVKLSTNLNIWYYFWITTLKLISNQL